MKTFFRLSIYIIFLNTFLSLFAFTQSQNILTYLPITCEFKGWDLEDSARVFVGESLYMLIDGGADIYFEYGFRQVVKAEYRNSYENSIKLEIYEMSDASAAYGIFSLNVGTRGKKVQIGNEGMLFEYYLMFWKNTFLVFLTGADTTGETISSILSMAVSIDQRLGAPGIKPALVSCLPNSGLQSSAFVRGNIGLSSFYTFDTKNIFRMKEGVVGSYPTHTLFIFQYNSDKEAEEQLKKAQEVLKTSSRFSDFKEHARRCTMTDQKGAQLCMTYFKNVIVVVISKQKNDVMAICDNVISSLFNR
jgi:hypothetical protein